VIIFMVILFFVGYFYVVGMSVLKNIGGRKFS